MPSRFLRFMILASPIMLAACGDGWEMVRVDDVVPYGNTRTAGTARNTGAEQGRRGLPRKAGKVTRHSGF